MLAGDGAAHFHALLQDFAGELFGAAQLVRVVGVEKDQRVQVAVTRVKHVGAAQRVFPFHLADEEQDFPEAAARDGAVHAVVVGRDAAHRRKRRLAPGPELLPLGIGVRHAQARRPRILQNGFDAGDLLVHLLRRTVGLAQQQRRRLQVVARVHEILHRAHRGTVHHFQSRGNDARRDDVGDRVAGLFHIVEGGEHDARRLRLREELHRDLRHHAEHALTADEEREQV